MTIEYQLERDKYIKLHQKYCFNTINFVEKIVQIWIIGFGICLLSLFCTGLIGPNYNKSIIIILLIVAILILIIITIIYYKNFSSKISNLYSSSIYKDYFNKMNINIDNTEIKVIAEKVITTYHWESLYKLYKFGGYMFILTISNDIIVLPLYLFNNDEKSNIQEFLLRNTNLKIKNQFPIEVKYI